MPATASSWTATSGSSPQTASSRSAGRRLVGREAIFDFFTKRPLAEKVATAPTIMRHNVTNVLFEELSPERIQVASYFTVFSDIGLDHMGRYRDTMVPEADAWRIAHRFVSTDWHSPESLFT